MHFATSELGIRRFYVKIGAGNSPSRHLFADKMGFQECNYVSAFDEYELELLVDDSTVENLLEGRRSAYDILACPDRVEGEAGDEQSPNAPASECETSNPVAR